MTQLDPLLSALSALAKHQGIDLTIRLEFSTEPCPDCRGKGVIRNTCPEMCEACEGTGAIPPLEWDEAAAEFKYAGRDLVSILDSGGVWCEICGDSISSGHCQCEAQDYLDHLLGTSGATFRVVSELGVDDDER